MAIKTKEELDTFAQGLATEFLANREKDREVTTADYNGTPEDAARSMADRAVASFVSRKTLILLVVNIMAREDGTPVLSVEAAAHPLGQKELLGAIQCGLPQAVGDNSYEAASRAISAQVAAVIQDKMVDDAMTKPRDPNEKGN